MASPDRQQGLPAHPPTTLPIFEQSRWLLTFSNYDTECRYLVWRSEYLIKYERLVHTTIIPLLLLGTALRPPWLLWYTRRGPQSVVGLWTLLHCYCLWWRIPWYTRQREWMCLMAWLVNFWFFWRHARPCLLQQLPAPLLSNAPRFSWMVGAEPNILMPLCYIVRVRVYLPLAIMLGTLAWHHTRHFCADSALLHLHQGALLLSTRECHQRAMKMVLASLLFPLLVTYFIEMTSRRCFIRAVAARQRWAS